MDRERQLQIRAGVFTIVILVALGLMVGTLNREGGLFTPRYTLHAEFDNIEGLTENAPVHLAGNNVGRVRQISFLDPGAEKAIRVVLDLDARVADRIRSDSQATIRMHGLLGDMYVAISLGSSEGTALPDRGTLVSAEPFALATLTDLGGELLENLVGMSESAEQIVGAFDDRMATESIAETLASLSRIVAQLEEGDGLLHRLIYDDTSGDAIDELEGAVRALREIVVEVKEGDGVLHDLIYAEGGGQSTLVTLRDSARRLDSVLAKIDEGEGSLGAFVNDPGLYEDLRLVLRGARDSRLLRALIDFVRADEDGP